MLPMFAARPRMVISTEYPTPSPGKNIIIIFQYCAETSAGVYSHISCGAFK